MGGARPTEILASTELISVSNVSVLFHYLLWKAKLDLSALSEGLDSWSINVSCSMGSIASCGVMKTPSCIIRCVCVCVFFPFILEVRWTYQPGSHRRKVTLDFSSTFLRCVP